MLNIEEIVKKPTWRSILIDLIIKNKLNPWDIDISLLAKEYVKKIRALKEQDFRIAGNMVLASSILLKFQSLNLGDEEKEEVETFEDVYPTTFNVIVRRKRRRPITLNELLETMEKALKEYKPVKKEQPTNEFIEEEFIYEDIKEVENIEHYIEMVLKRIKETVDEYNLTTFSDIIVEDKVITLLSILFLSNEGIIEYEQKEILGEILIKLRGVNNEKH